MRTRLADRFSKVGSIKCNTTGSGACCRALSTSSRSDLLSGYWFWLASIVFWLSGGVPREMLAGIRSALAVANKLPSVRHSTASQTVLDIIRPNRRARKNLCEFKRLKGKNPKTGGAIYRAPHQVLDAHRPGRPNEVPVDESAPRGRLSNLDGLRHLWKRKNPPRAETGFGGGGPGWDVTVSQKVVV